MNNDEDLLNEEMSKHSPDTDQGASEEAEKPKKGGLTLGKKAAIIVLVGIGVYSFMTQRSMDDTSLGRSDTDSAETVEAGASSSTSESVSSTSSSDEGESVPINEPDLDSLLEVDGTIETMNPSTAGQGSREGPGEEEIFMGSEDVRQTVMDMDYLTKADFDREIQDYVPEVSFREMKSSFQDQIQRQSNRIQAQQATIESMESRLSEINQQLRSTELKVMMQTERPVLEQLSLVVPDQTCAVCNAKAIFHWQGTRTLVSEGTEWMGYEVSIDGDVLRLTNGSVSHDYSPGI